MNFETFLATHIDSQLSSMYFFDVAYKWITREVVNLLISIGYNQTIINSFLPYIWIYILGRKELWKSLDFLGYPNYLISTFGNVRTISSGYTTRGSKNSDGYLSAYLKGSDGKSKSMLIHPLGAQAFLSNSENKRTVDHINRDKENNHVLNLRWATDSEQCKNRVRKITNNSARSVYQTLE